MSHQLRATWVVTRRELLRFKQDKARMVTMLLQPLLFIFVMGVGLGTIVDTGGDTDFQTFLYPGRAGDLGAVHRRVRRHLAGLGPGVRLPARDDGRADLAGLDHLGQVPGRRDRRDGAEPDPAGAARHGRHPLLAGADRRAGRLPLPRGASAHCARRAALDADQDHPGRDAGQPAADHADDVPVRVAVPDHEPARVARSPHPAQPADLRRPADAALHPRRRWPSPPRSRSGWCRC